MNIEFVLICNPREEKVTGTSVYTDNDGCT